MEMILKLLNRIDNHVQSKNTQELLLDLGDSKRAKDRRDSMREKLEKEVKQLQELLDDKDNIDFIEEHYKVLSESFKSVFMNTDISLDKLKENAIGKEELYKYIEGLINKKK